MKLLHRLRSILDWMVRRSEAERQLDDELQSYIAMSAADKIANGVPPDEARRLARLELGGVEQVKEQVRTHRHGGWLDEIARDVRYAVRVSVKNRTFTVIVVLTLALGIGANTAIFSLIDALMLRWLPVRNPQELVMVSFQSRDSTGPRSLSYAIVGALADQRDVFSGVAGFSGKTFDVGASGLVSRVHGALVTGDFYATLGLNPVVGRLLNPADDQPGAPLTAVISYGYWERQFALSPQAIGQTLTIKDRPVTIVGVTPRGFVGANVGAIADITMSVAALPEIDPPAAPLLGRGNFWLIALARPQAGVSVHAATSRLNSRWPHISDPLIAPHWPPQVRKEISNSTFELQPGGTGWTYLREMYRKPLWVLMAAVALVLLIACANVASLQLARASARKREVAIRLAIGAARRRIVRQLLIESALLSLTGAVIGVGLAWMSSAFLIRMISTGFASPEFDLTPNSHILGFSLVVAIATGVLFGVAPALQTTAVSPAGALKEDIRVGRARFRLLPSLVVGQVALSLVLLAGAGLFARTLRNLRQLDPGFKADGVLLVNFEDRQAVIPPGFLEDVRRIPGVISASFSTHTPLNGSMWSEPAVPVGQQIPERDNAVFVGAGPHFFSTMQIQLLTGREFDDGDRPEGQAVAIVNQEYAGRHFPNSNPVGQHLAARVNGDRKDLEIVGLVRNINAAGLRRPSPAMVYVAYQQLKPGAPRTLAVRVSSSPSPVANALRQMLQAKLPGAPIDVRALSTQVSDTIVQERMLATLAGAFGGLALALACIGLYGLIAYNVARRIREIGIRMALGAQAPRVVALVIGGGARLVLIGVAVGLPIAWMASRWLKSLLFGLTPGDPWTLAGAIAALVTAALVAAYLPARRASHVDPLEALRQE